MQARRMPLETRWLLALNPLGQVSRDNERGTATLQEALCGPVHDRSHCTQFAALGGKGTIVAHGQALWAYFRFD